MKRTIQSICLLSLFFAEAAKPAGATPADTISISNQSTATRSQEAFTGQDIDLLDMLGNKDDILSGESKDEPAWAVSAKANLLRFNDAAVSLSQLSLFVDSHSGPPSIANIDNIIASNTSQAPSPELVGYQAELIGYNPPAEMTSFPVGGSAFLGGQSGNEAYFKAVILQPVTLLILASVAVMLVIPLLNSMKGKVTSFMDAADDWAA